MIRLGIDENQIHTVSLEQTMGTAKQILDYGKQTRSDAIVMGTPVYWYQVTAQFKMLVDRLYSFLEFGEKPDTGEVMLNCAFPADKQAVFIISRGDPEEKPGPAQFFKIVRRAPVRLRDNTDAVPRCFQHPADNSSAK